MGAIFEFPLPKLSEPQTLVQSLLADKYIIHFGYQWAGALQYAAYEETKQLQEVNLITKNIQNTFVLSLFLDFSPKLFFQFSRKNQDSQWSIYRRFPINEIRGKDTIARAALLFS